MDIDRRREISKQFRLMLDSCDLTRRQVAERMGYAVTSFNGALASKDSTLAAAGGRLMSKMEEIIRSGMRLEQYLDKHYPLTPDTKVSVKPEALVQRIRELKEAKSTQEVHLKITLEILVNGERIKTLQS